MPACILRRTLGKPAGRGTERPEEGDWPRNRYRRLRLVSIPNDVMRALRLGVTVVLGLALGVVVSDATDAGGPDWMAGWYAYDYRAGVDHQRSDVNVFRSVT